MWELTKSFRFEAAHALTGTTLGEASEEIHGHSFRAEVSIRGTPNPETGMVLDLGLLDAGIAEVRKQLDHKLLNKVEALGLPTLENLSRFIWERVEHAGQLTRVSVHRDSCNESCTLLSGRKAELSSTCHCEAAKRRRNPAFLMPRQSWIASLRNSQ